MSSRHSAFQTAALSCLLVTLVLLAPSLLAQNPAPLQEGLDGRRLELAQAAAERSEIQGDRAAERPASPGPRPGPALALQGRVLDPDGREISGAVLRVTRPERPGERALREAGVLGLGLPTERPGIVGRSGPEGGYSLGVEKGIWQVEASAPGFVAKCLDLVPLLEEHRLPTVTLERARALRITVVDAAGKPLEGALLRVDPTGREENRWGACTTLERTREDGSATVQGVEGSTSGTAVQVFHPGFLERSVSLRDGSRISLERSEPLELGIHVRCEDCPRLEDSQPSLVAVAGRGRWPVAVGDSQEHLLVPALPGPERQIRILSADGRGVDVAIPSDPVGSGGPLQVTLPEHRLYSGHLLEARSDPMARIAGGVVWSSEEIAIWDVSGSDGGFRLLDIPVGSARPGARSAALSAQAVGYHRGDQDFYLGEQLSPEAESRVAFPELDFWLEPSGGFWQQKGWVTDPDGEPVSGARVSIVPSGWAPETTLALAGVDPPPSPYGIQTSETDAEGLFSLRVRAGVYDLTVTHPDFAPAVFRGIGIPEAATEMGTFPVPRGSAVSGFVVDEEGNAVAEASVEVDFPARHQGKSSPIADRTRDVVRTGPDGSFRLTRLPSTDLDLRVSKPGFAPRTLALRPPTSKVLAVTLAALSKLRGRVVDEGYRPIPGAIVAGGQEDSSRQGKLPSKLEASIRTESDTEGRFVLEGVAPGRWRLWVEAEGYAAAEVRDLDLGAGEDRRGLEVVLSQGYRLSGTVLSPAGLPVGGALVEVGGQRAKTDSAGGFEISEPLPEDRAVIWAHHGEVGSVRKTVEIRRDPEPVELRLEPGLTLAGRVLTPDGEPVQEGHVTLLDGYERPLDMALLAAGGRFVFQGLEPGRYFLAATAPPFTLYGRGKSSREVTLEEQSIEDLALVLNLRRTLRGRVVGLDANEVANVVVEAFSDELPVAGGQARPRADGRFELEALPLGDWVVSASLLGTSRSAARSVRLTRTEQLPQVLELSFGEGAQLRGRVLHNQEPLDGAEVSWLANGGALVSSRTDWQGEFTLEEVPAEVGALRIVSRDGGLGVTVVVDRQSTSDLSVNLETAPLSGVVLRRDGTPLTHAELALVPLSSQDSRVRPNGVIFLSTDASGEFHLQQLPLGRYALDLVGAPDAAGGTIVEVSRASEPSHVLVTTAVP